MKSHRSLAELAEDGHLQGLRGFRSALTAAHLRLDRQAPAMETRDLAMETPHGAMPARLYRPHGAAATPGPALVFFHGGGFVICDLETHDAFCRRLAEAAGMRIIAVDYRLAPEAPFPAQLEDGEAAVRWTIEHGPALGVDPAKLLVGGDSAGGYIALAAALAFAQPRALAGQVLIYPLLDLNDEVWASSFFAHSRVVGRLAVGYIRTQLKVGEVAPLTGADLSRLGPTLLALGGALDPCSPDGQRLAEQLRDAGRRVEVLEYPRLPHGFGNLTHLSPASRRALAEIGGRMSALLAPASAAR